VAFLLAEKCNLPLMRRIVPSTCWECSTCCGALLSVEDGQVREVAPNPEHPASRGAFCIKGIRGMPGLAYGEERVLHPMRRAGPRGSGQWTRVSWDAALDEMAERLDAVRKQHGPLALAGATSGAFFSRSVVLALLMRSLGSPNWMINQDLCGGCRAVSDMVTGLGIHNGEDVERTRTVLMVGANPHMANPLQWQRIKAARERGAKIVVLDPLRTQAAALATRWLRPRPGTDAAIALAMMHVLIAEGRYDRAFVERWCHGFERLHERVMTWTPERAAGVSGVDKAEIRAAARDYAEGPACFVSGHGIDAMSNGVQTFRAFHCLVAISGNVDRPGGNRRIKRPKGFRTGLDLLHDRHFRLEEEIERQTIGADRFPLWAGPEGWQTACHNPSVIEAMLTGRPYPVRALYVSGVNIAVTYPDTPRTLTALRSLDFLAVATQHMTPTAALADLLLPKTVTLEEEEVTLHAAGPCLAYTAPVSARRGEARTDVEIAAALLDRMEHRPLMPWRTQRDYIEFTLRDTGIGVAEVAERGFLEFPWKWDEHTKKVALYAERMAKHGLDPLPDWVAPASSRNDQERYPLRLQTGLRERTYHHSRFREQPWARKVSPDPLISIHPRTAEALGVRDGDWVEVRTRGHEGRCRLKAKLSAATAPDTVVTGMGWWRPEAPGPEYGALDVNINAALSYAGPYDPASGSADTRGIPCRLELATRS
jgi:thiosulfate reductase / polysulfide reductase chain A